MGLDQLLELTSSVASKALPICGVVVLIFLAVFVKHLIVLLKNANDAVVKMSKTLETTNRQLETLDKPLNTLNELSEEALIQILKEPKNALTKQYQKLFELDGVALDFDKEALEAIADKALERKTGARGLRAIMEAVTLDLMYHIPSDESITQCQITKEMVDEQLAIEERELEKIEEKQVG